MSKSKKSPFFYRFNLIQGSTLSHYEKAVLICMLSHDGLNGIFPSRARIAKLTSICDSTVKRTIKRLTDQGVIFITKNAVVNLAGKRVRLDSNFYEINELALTRLQFVLEDGSQRTNEQTYLVPGDPYQGSGRTNPGVRENPPGGPGDPQTAKTTTELTFEEPPPSEKAGRGPSDGAEDQHIQHLPERYQPLIKDVEREVNIKPSSVNPANLATYLIEFLNSFPGIMAIDLIRVLSSNSFKGLDKLSWGLIFFDKKGVLLKRFTRLVSEAIEFRKRELEFCRTPDNDILMELTSANRYTRLSAVTNVGRRFDETGNNKWLRPLLETILTHDELRQRGLITLGDVLMKRTTPLPRDQHKVIADTLAKFSDSPDYHDICEGIMESMEGVGVVH